MSASKGVPLPERRTRRIPELFARCVPSRIELARSKHRKLRGEQPSPPDAPARELCSQWRERILQNNRRRRHRTVRRRRTVSCSKPESRGTAERVADTTSASTRWSRGRCRCTGWWRTTGAPSGDRRCEPDVRTALRGTLHPQYRGVRQHSLCALPNGRIRLALILVSCRLYILPCRHDIHASPAQYHSVHPRCSVEPSPRSTKSQGTTLDEKRAILPVAGAHPHNRCVVIRRAGVPRRLRRQRGTPDHSSPTHRLSRRGNGHQSAQRRSIGQQERHDLPRLNISLMDPDGESPPERLWPTSERPSSHDMRVRGAGPDSDPVSGAVPAQEPGSDLSLRATSVG